MRLCVACRERGTQHPEYANQLQFLARVTIAQFWPHKYRHGYLQALRACPASRRHRLHQSALPGPVVCAATPGREVVSCVQN